MTSNMPGVVDVRGQLDPSRAAGVTIATYNEADNLQPLLEQLLALRPAIGVVVVDDGSPDGTGQIADRWAEENPGRVAVVHRQGKLGYASAVRTGLRMCYDAGFDVLVVMDCDHSHDPAVIPVMLEKIAEADMVIGSRYVPGGGTMGWPWYRRLLSRLGGAVARALTGMTVRDPTGGFRAFRRELLDRIGIWHTKADGYAFLTEVAFRAWLSGARIVEVPIIFRDRERGKSKLSKRIIWEAAMLVFALGWVSRWPPARRRYLAEMSR